MGTGTSQGHLKESQKVPESSRSLKGVSRHPHEFKGSPGISGESPVVSGAFGGVSGAFR